MSRLMLNLHRTAAQNYDSCTVTVDPSTVCTSSLQFTSRFGISETMITDESDPTGNSHGRGDRIRIQSAGQIISLPPVEEVLELAELDAGKEIPLNFMICPV